MEAKYFNFPIQLLKGFLTSPAECLDNISDYSLVRYARDTSGETTVQAISDVCGEFDINPQVAAKVRQNGLKLLRGIPERSPMVGLSLKLYWEYYENEKNDFEKVTLLAYLAMKSIIQNKAYQKLDNRFWYSRMDGNVTSCEPDQLSTEVRFFLTEHYSKKLRRELVDNWGLTTYSRYTRGFYVSFQLPLEGLIFEAEKRRKAMQEKQNKAEINQAYEKAIKRLNSG